MRNAEFLKRVDSGERSFAKGDLLRVELRSTPHVTPEGLRTDHEVIRVIEEIKISRQTSLLPEPDDE